MFKKILPAIACTAALLMSGCAFNGGGVVSTSGSTSPLSKGNMGGVAHGGRQGIYNATVSLYAMSTSTANYGDTPIMYAQTKTIDANGTFAFVKGADGAMTTLPTTLTGNALPAWSCPAGASTGTPGSATDPYMYLVASGGDTSGKGAADTPVYNNTFAKLVLVLGDCASIYPTELVTINEATTVASMVALQQFFNPATQAIGAPNTTTGKVGLTNAVNMISNLVVNSSGEFQTSVTYTASPTSSAAGVTVIAAPEGSKLSTMANVLAACVSSDGTTAACTALAANAVSPSTAPPGTATGQITTEGPTVTNFPSVTYPAVSDTLQAIDYMMINPTNSQDYGATGRLHNLYALSTTGTQPFGAATGSTSPAPLTTQPIDWTVGINFTASGTCNTGITGGTSQFVFDPYSMAVDKSGNIWMGGWAATTTNAQNNALTEISPLGAPLACISANLAGGGLTNGSVVTIDSQGNVWYPADQGLLEVILDSTNSAYAGTTSPKVFLWNQPLQGDQSGTTIPYKVGGVVADLTGNIFVAPYAAPAASASSGTPLTRIYEYPGAASSSTVNGVTPVAIGDTDMVAGSVPFRVITLNSSGTLMTTGTVNGNSALNTWGYVKSGGSYTDTALAATGTTFYGDALETDGTTITGTTCCGTTGKISAMSAVATTNPVSASGYNAGGANSNRSLAVDGAGNIWTGESGSYANDLVGGTGTLIGLGEADKAYNAIAPAGIPYAGTKTCTTPCATGGSFLKTYTPTKPGGTTGNLFALAIDNSGNVWGAVGSAAPAAESYFTIVGQAVPVPTPMLNNIH